MRKPAPICSVSLGGAPARGFTLLEVLVTLAVAAVLLGIAVPSYRGLVERNTLAARVNDLVGDLYYARSQAVTRGRTIFLCKRANPNTSPPECSSDGDWSQGWIIYLTDLGSASPDFDNTTDTALRVRAALDQPVTIAGDDHTEDRISFGANGFARGSNGRLTASAPRPPTDTDIVIAITGRIRTEKKDSS